MMMSMPKPDERARERFRAALPDDPRVTARPMFGSLAGFVNGNMFMGLHGADIFVRLDEAERAALLAEPGAQPFAPIAGRPMREYVVFPGGWRDTPAHMQPWIDRSLAWAATLPEKAGKSSRTRPRAGGR